jgi:hypothetical protein
VGICLPREDMTPFPRAAEPPARIFT